MASMRPGVVAKPSFGKEMSPALQKFMERQNAVLEGKENSSASEQEAPSVAAGTPRKPSLVSGTKAGWNKVTGGDSEEKDASKNSANKTSNGSVSELRRGSNTTPLKQSENRRVSVPKVFQQGDSANSNEAPKPWAKPPANSPTDENKPKVQSKPFAKPGGASNLRPTTALKPPAGTNSKPPAVPSEKPSSAIKSEVNGVGSAISRFKQIEVNKTPASITNSTASSTSSSTSSHTPESPSASEPGKIDFRSQLRSTKKYQGFGTKTLTPVVPPAVPLQKQSNEASEMDETASAKKTAVAAISAALAKKSPTAMPGMTRTQPELKRQSSNMILERKSDSKKFKKVKLQVQPLSGTAPPKPALLRDLDLSLVRQQYQKAVQMLESSEGQGDEDDDEIYPDATSTFDILPRRSLSKRQSERISLIPDMSAEEEGVLDEDGPIYDDGYTPTSRPQVPIPGDEVYVDAETERKEEDEGDFYEAGEDFVVPQESEEDKKKRLKEETEAKKREERERRENKKEEERRRKREEKEKAKKEKLRKQFNLTGDETDVGEGVIKQDVKGWGFGGLSVKKGQIVTIMRLDNNPPNKWLIRTETGMDYIDSSIIEVDPAIIRQAMNRNVKRSISEDQPVYDAVAQDGAPEVDDEVDDADIYEECPE